MSPTPLPPTALSRRDALAAAGATVSLAVLAGACGASTAEAPGRVGNAPVPTPLPDVTVDDALLARTGMSLEHTVMDVYDRFLEAGWAAGDAAPILARFTAEHSADADVLADMATEAGGEAYGCANTWLEDRMVAPLMAAIEGDEGAGIAPSDDPARDVVTVAYGLESMSAATYQQFVEKLTDPARRVAAVGLAARAARRAAVLAILQTGAPEGYVSPTLWGETVDPSQTDGIAPLFAVESRFGSLAGVEITVGAKSDAGTRTTFSLETPADNAYVAPDASCQA